MRPCVRHRPRRGPARPVKSAKWAVLVPAEMEPEPGQIALWEHMANDFMASDDRPVIVLAGGLRIERLRP